VGFAGVGFRHKDAVDDALQDVSFGAALGQTVAFVGPSGSGKSTLVKLLVGLYAPAAGEVFYNDTSTTELRFNLARRQIGLVTQETHLFAGTLRENIRFAKPDATDPEIVAAMEQASIAYLLTKSGDGLDTVIGESGMKLSGGERQRLSIARALIRRPPLLIFDEATSSLDSLTEEHITSTVRALSAQGERITILIAHRLSTVMHADTIFVLEKGRIVESGAHAALLEQKGLYYAMWRQQIGERPSAQVVA
jgi:ATP-binding cassette subfamily B protein